MKNKNTAHVRAESPTNCSMLRQGHENGFGIKLGPKLGSDTLCRTHIREPSIHFIIIYVWLHRTLFSIGALHLKECFLHSLLRARLNYAVLLALLLNAEGMT